MNFAEKTIIWSRSHPVGIIVVVSILTAFFGWSAIINTRLDASAGRMMKAADPERVFYQETLDTFGSDNSTVIYIRDENLFTYEKLSAIEEVFYNLQNIKGVERVDGLFNAKRFKGGEDGLDTTPLMDPVPEEQSEIDRVKEDALTNPLLKNLMISKDAKVTAITVIVNSDPNDESFDERFSYAVDQTIEPLKGKVQEVFQIGTPFTRRSILEHILQDQLTLIPAGVFILLVLLVLGLKTFNGAVIPVITGGLSVIWAIGFMGMLDIPIQVLTVIVPSMILVLGATEDMHIISEYFNGIEEGNEKLGAIDYMSRKVGTAVSLTAFTTVVGFASIILNELTLLREFGIAAAFGLFVNFWITLTVVPVALRLFGEKKSPFRKDAESEKKKGGFNPFTPLAEHSIKMVKNHRKAVGITLIVMCVLSVIGITRIKVDNDLLGYFKSNSEIRKRAERLHEDLSGAQLFYVVLSTHHEGDFKSSNGLKSIIDIQKYMDESGDFDNTLSIAENISLIHQEMNGGKSEFFRIPDNDDLISQYFLTSFTPEETERYLNSDATKANIVVRHNLSSSYELKEALGKLSAYLDKKLSDTDIKYRFTSESILINNAAESIAVGQVESLALIGFVIFVLMCALFVNIKAGLLSLVPNLVPIVLLFGVMGWFGIPLNPGTAMIAAIAIGIAVDDTIHFMVRYNAEMKIHNNQITAMESTIREEVRPVLTTSIALAFGFGSMGLSSFVPLVYFGTLSALVMILALMSDLWITPMLLVSTKLITLWDMLKLKIKESVIKESPLFRNMTPWQVKKIILLGHTREFSRNQYIIEQGKKERTMYLILNGDVKIEHIDESGEKVEIGMLSTGDIVGEIALMDEVERTASVVAIDDETTVLEFDWESLERVRRIFPNLSSKLYLNISRILGRRLAAADSQLHSKPQLSAASPT